MSTSKLQRQLSFALSTHFGKYTIRENARPLWLRGPHYERLELDFWIEELDIAIEVQGQQHYTYTPFFHGSYEGFKAQQERDRAKRKRCEDYQILLLEVDDYASMIDAINTIDEKIQILRRHQPKRGVSPTITARIEDICRQYQTLLDSDLNFNNFRSSLGSIKIREVAIRERFRHGNLFQAADETLSRLGQTKAQIDERIEDFRAEETVKHGLFPGEEVVWICRPDPEVITYSHNAFVLWATATHVWIRLSPTKKNAKPRRVRRGNVVSAIHAFQPYGEIAKKGRAS